MRWSTSKETVRMGTGQGDDPHLPATQIRTEGIYSSITKINTFVKTTTQQSTLWALSDKSGDIRRKTSSRKTHALCYWLKNDHHFLLPIDLKLFEEQYSMIRPEIGVDRTGLLRKQTKRKGFHVEICHRGRNRAMLSRWTFSCSFVL